MKRETILLTFNGKQDPYNRENKDGPILQFMEHKNKEIKAIYLFYTLDKKDKAEKTKQYIHDKYNIEVHFFPVTLDDPIDYRVLLRELRKYVPQLLRDKPLPDYLILLSPGTPQMHASWFLLAASGEIPARLCQTREAKLIDLNKNWGPISEIDPNANWFPAIRQYKISEKISKPAETDEIKTALEKTGIVSGHKSIKEIIKKTVKFAKTNETVMILGESGTGKELFARFIHNLSERRDNPFITTNCGSIPEGLAESELFGHEKGAFTGSISKRVGVFEQANKGTLFLDEIGDMLPNIQVKILRAIQEKEITPIGGKAKKINVRIVAATHQNLADMVSKGRFREDLFFRLNVLSIKLPPLREREEDIPLLVDHILVELNKTNKDTKGFSKEALLKLKSYSWIGGNVRFLKNIIKRAYYEVETKLIDHNDITFEENETQKRDGLPVLEFYNGFNIDTYCSKIRDALVEKALKETKTSAEAARLLGVTNTALYNRKHKKKS